MKRTLSAGLSLTCSLLLQLSVLPASAVEPALEADWRQQDGIGTEREPRTYAAALERVFARGDALVQDLQAGSPSWEALRQEWNQRRSGSADDSPEWESLWRRVHECRRQIVFSNPLTRTGPLLFIRQVPGSFSHQLTQVYGRYARPGGGVFVLDVPGESLTARPLVTGEPGEGSFQTPDVSFDGQRILFAFCTTDEKRDDPRYYHLFRMNADGSGLRQLTRGPFDDFSPRFLPDGTIVFVTTRRGGFHRCGSPGCPVYTLAAADADGGNIHLLSHHEVQEWDPAVMHDGRILYTRWDYVDRHAVFGEHLWTAWPDGSRPSAYYGNYTRNPVGLWEAQAVPGSHRIMATAAAHHAMTAGSIVLVDVERGSDGLAPLTRLTPETPFPESEIPVSGRWFFPAADARPADSEENRRWPGHCYRTPWPLSENYFIAAFSYDPLVGEPNGNLPGMFGLYLVDAFGNRELLHRDPAISSLWPVPLRPRPRPQVLPSLLPSKAAAEGTFVLQDVYAGLPETPPGSVKRLRVVQVLPKTTSGKDQPPVGAAAGSPGKAVLGTVPVEPDGSAHFTVPSGIPLLFQALDERGQAVQIMRSATSVQPGEQVTCAGCHEPRHRSPQSAKPLLALARSPSRIAPGPDGSRPFSYPLLVQGVLDRKCVSCHRGADSGGGVVLTGELAGAFTASYNALVTRVPFSNDTNPDALSRPGQFGARGSSVMKLLLESNHHGVTLEPAEIERLATWMDTNALFYGTFDPADQERQRRGETIGGPKLE